MHTTNETTGPSASTATKSRRWWGLSSLRDAQAGRNMPYAFLAGLILGPVGVALILRSWVEGIALAAAFFALAIFFPSIPAFMYWLAYGLWTVARVTMRGVGNSTPRTTTPVASSAVVS